MLPAVNVFFEFGRQGAIFGQPNIEAFRLIDIAHHTRLPDVAQVAACLDLINQAFGRVCGDASAKFCGFDREGRCFIAAETQQNILRLWQKLIASQQLARDGQPELAAARTPTGASLQRRGRDGSCSARQGSGYRGLATIGASRLRHRPHHGDRGRRCPARY